MSAQAFFQWCELTRAGAVIRDSRWLFPAIEIVHLLALAWIGGAVILVDLRLLGLGIKKYPVNRLAKAVEPWLIGGLAVMLTTGVFMFLSEAMKCYGIRAFWLKMLFLALALVYTFTLRRMIAKRAIESGVLTKLAAVVSLSLWTVVGVCGRWIGFS